MSRMSNLVLLAALSAVLTAPAMPSPPVYTGPARRSKGEPAVEPDLIKPTGKSWKRKKKGGRK